MSTMGYVTTLTGAEDAASLKLDFGNQDYKVVENGVLTTKKLSDIVQFTRSSTGGRYNADGLYETVAVNAPRLDYNPVTKVLKGILIEGQRTNVIKCSNFQSVGWTKSNAKLIENQALAPDGTWTAALFENTIGVNSYINQPITASATPTAVSYYIKPNGANCIIVLEMATGDGGAITFNAVTKTFSGNASATKSYEEVGNGWLRVSINTTGMNRATFVLYSAILGASALQHSGYIWGVQVENSANFVSSYIPTPPAFTSRATAATYFDRLGVMQVAGVNVPRSDSYVFTDAGVASPAGLLLEASSTNLLRMSNESLGTSPWDYVGGFTNPALGIDGTLSATKFTESLATATTREIRQLPGFTSVVGTTYTYSVYAKASEGAARQLRMNYTTSSILSGTARVTFNLATQTTALVENVTARIQKMPNGWARYSMTVTATAVATPTVYISLLSAGAPSYTGDGVSGMVLFGPQLEIGATATSYMKAAGTFTSRSTTATYTNASGTLSTADVNVARDSAYQYDTDGKLKSLGLLLEGASTNQFTESAALETTAWGKNSVSVVPSETVAPDSLGRYRTITSTNSSGATGSIYKPNPAVSTSTITTMSAYVKAGTTDKCQLRFYDTSNAAIATFNLTTGVVESSSGPVLVGATITPVTGGAFRISMSINYGARPSGGLAAYLYVNFNSPAVGDSILAWGMQLEVSPTATSYIPTTTATATRAADVFASTTATRAADVFASPTATRTSDLAQISSLGSWYDPAQGTMKVVVSHILGASSINKHILGLQGDSSADWMAIRNATNVVQVGQASSTAGAGVVAIVGPTVADGVEYSSALRYKLNDAGFSVSGGAAGTDNTCQFPAVPAFTKMVIGQYTSGSQSVSGWIKYISHFKQALTDSQLALITV